MARRWPSGGATTTGRISARSCAWRHNGGWADFSQSCGMALQSAVLGIGAISWWSISKPRPAYHRELDPESRALRLSRWRSPTGAASTPARQSWRRLNGLLGMLPPTRRAWNCRNLPLRSRSKP